jgi:hypothetical protein
VLQLVGNDSALQALDTVSITLSGAVTLSVVTSGPGGVTLDPPGGSYVTGQSVTVTAVPEPGAAFTGFGDDLAGIGNPQPLTLDGHKTVSAHFAPVVGGCGMGPELALLLPLLGALRRRHVAGNSRSS